MPVVLELVSFLLSATPGNYVVGFGIIRRRYIPVPVPGMSSAGEENEMNRERYLTRSISMPASRDLAADSSFFEHSNVTCVSLMWRQEMCSSDVVHVLFSLREFNSNWNSSLLLSFAKISPRSFRCCRRIHGFRYIELD